MQHKLYLLCFQSIALLFLIFTGAEITKFMCAMVVYDKKNNKK